MLFSETNAKASAERPTEQGVKVFGMFFARESRPMSSTRRLRFSSWLIYHNLLTGRKARLQMVSLGLLFDTSGTSVNVIVATLAGDVSEALKKRSGFMRFEKLVPASILIALGLLVVFT